MSAKTSPISPALLEWGLHEDGRSAAAVASALGVERAVFDGWIQGTAQPTPGQVTELAEALSRPRAFFFLAHPPPTGAVPDGFRHPPGGGESTVSPATLRHARRAKRVQLAIAATVTDDQRPQVPTASRERSPAQAAAAVRTWLGVPDSVGWSDDYEALRWWKAILETAGVLVFDLQLGGGAVRGFAGWDDRAPMIVLNNSSVSAAARIFTIGHELAHLVLREATACLEPTGSRLVIDNRTERWCEAFAAALLMPAGQVHALMRENSVDRGDATIATVKTMMATFRVSARAAAIRLDDLGYAGEGLYAAVLKVFKVGKGAASSTPKSPRRHVLRVRQYGAGTVARVLNTLPPTDALSVLRMTVEDVRALADEVDGVPVL